MYYYKATSWLQSKALTEEHVCDAGFSVSPLWLFVTDACFHLNKVAGRLTADGVDLPVDDGDDLCQRQTDCRQTGHKHRRRYRSTRSSLDLNDNFLSKNHKHSATGQLNHFKRQVGTFKISRKQ